ncbi:MAG: MGH1-like glycoside hydrolase domain-containing protein, partial [Candidatus Dormibacteraceae bacterium]
RVFEQRAEEANAFFDTLAPSAMPPAEAQVVRQAFAGVLWSKQFYHYDVKQWLEGDPASPAPPEERKRGRNSDWPNFKSSSILTVPDKWEYPWPSGWESAFSSVVLARVCPEDAKQQLLGQLQEWHLNPSGQLAGNEASLSRLTPPIQAWAALRVSEAEDKQDLVFLERIWHKLLVNFTWWVNQVEGVGPDILAGGDFNLDVMNTLDSSRSEGYLGRFERLSWLAMYCLNMLELTLTLAVGKPAYEDMASRFLEYFTLLAKLLEEKGIWDEDDGFYYDFLRPPSGAQIPLRFRSIAGLIPLLAVTVISTQVLDRLPNFARRMELTIANQLIGHQSLEHIRHQGPN